MLCFDDAEAMVNPREGDRNRYCKVKEPAVTAERFFSQSARNICV
jgi:hypothetical protein